MNYKKNYFKNFVLFGSAIIIAVILSEMLLRIFWSPQIVDDPYLNWRGSGNGFDDNGFRNEQTLSEAEIVAIGDSMTYGAGSKMNEAWPQVLGNLSGKVVYQMALGGYGPVQYSYLLDQAINMKANTVIFGFFMGNDFYDSLRLVYENENWLFLGDDNYHFNDVLTPAQAENFNKLFLENEKGPIIIKWLNNSLRPISTRLYLSLFIKSFFINLKNNESNLGQSEQINEIKKYLNEYPEVGYYYEINPQETLLTPTYSLMSLSDKDLAEATSINRELFLAADKKATEHGIKLLILIIPTKEFVYATSLLNQSSKLPYVLQQIFQRQQTVLRETESFCLKNDLACLSILNPLANSLTAGDKIYHDSVDAHPNEAGYRIMAESAWQYLKNDLWKTK